MKYLSIFALAMLMAIPVAHAGEITPQHSVSPTVAEAGLIHKARWINGYTRRDGTYVRGHMRSKPNNTKWDNYGCINGGRC